MDQEKFNFVTKDCISLFNRLQANAVAKWGKMNTQQMIEHVSAVFIISTGKIKAELATPVEHLPKYMEFLYSDKQFRENTKAPEAMLGEEAPPLRYATIDEAKQKLAEAIAFFQSYFTSNEGVKIMHPVFGELNYAEWVLMHYKHVTHHLRQFGLLEN
ncbi:MAG: DUF1569 domain-containing protein [Ferruginibacter sp.]